MHGTVAIKRRPMHTASITFSRVLVSLLLQLPSPVNLKTEVQTRLEAYESRLDVLYV